MKGQAQGEYGSLLADIFPLLKAYDQIDDENVDYMVSNDEHSEEQSFEEFRKFDPDTANNYKTMFEVVTRKVKMQALREGKLDIAKQMLRKGEPTDKINLAFFRHPNPLLV